MTRKNGSKHSHHSRYAVTYLCSNVPEITEPEKWPQGSLDLNPSPM